AVNPIR
nr:angiotensin-converting enzyme inhibitor (FLP-1) - common fig [Ficus carica]